MLKTDKDKESRGFFVYFAAIAVNIISFAVGIVYTWSSPVVSKLQKVHNNNPLGHSIDTVEESWITSTLMLGALVGPFVAVGLSDRIGRKNTLLLVAIPITISHCICYYASNITVFYFARFLAGIGSGCVFSVVPSYVADIAEDNNRGLLGCFMSLSMSLGNVFMYLIGPHMNIQVISIVNIVCLVLFFVSFGIFVPESPYYLITSGKEEEAKESLKKIRSKPDNEIEKEMLYISECIEESKKNEGGFNDLFKNRGLVKALMISLGLVIFNQLSGITAILAFMQKIFEGSGSKISSEWSSVLAGGMQIVGTTITLQIIEKLGRRIILMVSTTGVFISLLTLGMCFYHKEHIMHTVHWLPIASVITYILSYSLGLGPLPFAIAAELFPNNVKRSAMTVISFVYLIVAFFITFSFNHISELLGMHVCLWLFGACCGFCFLFSLFVLPETKGKSLQEIQDMLNNNTDNTDSNKVV